MPEGRSKGPNGPSVRPIVRAFLMPMNEPRIQSAPCLRERVVGSTTVVELRGEIDIQTAPPASARLDALTSGPTPSWCWTCDP